MNVTELFAPFISPIGEQKRKNKLPKKFGQFIKNNVIVKLMSSGFFYLK